MCLHFQMLNYYCFFYHFLKVLLMYISLLNKMVFSPLHMATLIIYLLLSKYSIDTMVVFLSSMKAKIHRFKKSVSSFTILGLSQTKYLHCKFLTLKFNDSVFYCQGNFWGRTNISQQITYPI